MNKQSSIIPILIFFLLVLTACSQDNVNEHARTPVKASPKVEDCKTILQEDIDKKSFTDDKINYGMCLLLDDRYMQAWDLFISIKSEIGEGDKLLNYLIDSASFFDRYTTFSEYTKLDARYAEIDKEFYDKNGYYNMLLSSIRTKMTNRAFETEDYKARVAVAEYEKKYYAPKIGMTAEEVKKSTWGEPKKINKTTTAYGVSEQWVYYGDKYIYLENGVVTSIQE